MSPAQSAKHCGSTASNSIPTSFVIAENLPTGFANLAVDNGQDHTESAACFGVTQKWGKISGNNGGNQKGTSAAITKFASHFHEQWRNRLRTMRSSEISPNVNRDDGQNVHAASSMPGSVSKSSCSETLFPTSGTVGIVDLGASQTIVGDKQIPELLESLPQHIRDRGTRTNCSLT